MHCICLIRLSFLGSAIAMLSTALTSAHDMRPVYFELTERDAGQFDVVLRSPVHDGVPLAIEPLFPPGCLPITPHRQYWYAGSIVEEWRVDCGSQGIEGREIIMKGLSVADTDMLLRVTSAGGVTHTRIVRPAAPSFVIDGPPSTWDVIRDYFVLGLDHILGGFDHLLFVLGLLLIVRGFRLLIETITAFTIAHSITLGLATLGVVHIPGPPVEAVIALSILFLACELVHAQRGPTGLAKRYPWIVAFTFGLLHGFGFAGALTEIGLPHAELPLALLMFNVGVEMGQLLFVAIALSLLWLTTRFFRWPDWAPTAAAYTIGSVAAYWVVERVAGFW